ncbi:MAG: OmpA family protein [Campylobacterota bacterium]|nr:OmpA family protein [Campylobacterota bacterium]
MIFVKKQNNDTKNEFWIGFSDLMTGLMLVFIVLSLTFMAIAKQKIDEMQEQRKNIIVILSEKLATNDIKVEYNAEKGTVTIAQDILFERKKPDLNPEGKKFIQLFANILDENILNNKKYKELIKYIHIEGYASKEGSLHTNFYLSFERAKNVWLYMTKKDIKNRTTMKHMLNIVSRGEIDANQTTVDPNDRKVIFRFEFYDTYAELFKGLSK